MLKDLIKFQLKRVNPFQGLVIDTDIWRDAHEYHRNQQRIHLLAFHDIGIVGGLEVVASKPPDQSVSIQPGMAVDPDGNIIVVVETQRYRIQSHETGTIYLIIQFREVPAEPYQPPEGGQPTRILEAYRIQETGKLPDEPHLELARVMFDPADGEIRDAKNPSKPGKNEINITFRKKTGPALIPPIEKLAAQDEVITQAPEVRSQPTETIAIGHIVLGEASKDLHVLGLQNLIREINREGRFALNLVENIPLDKTIKQCSLIYLTGNGHFEITDTQQAALDDFLQSGAVILGEGCAKEHQSNASNGSKEFGLDFNRLANQLNCKLEIVKRSHPLLSALHVFSDVPQGTETPMLLEGGHMIYSASDYGCAWQGGYEDQPLSRDIIRSSIEMGANIIAYAKMVKASNH